MSDLIARLEGAMAYFDGTVKGEWEAAKAVQEAIDLLAVDPETRIEMPNSVEKAKGMVLLGESWLKEQAPDEIRQYIIGDRTFDLVFRPTGMTNVSDWQTVLDQVERVLVEQAGKT